MMYSVQNAESESPSQSVEYVPCSSWSNEAAVANEYVAVDANNTAAPCAVCLDVGSGFHYGVYTCEGCKSFFKRTLQKNLVYQCKENGGCPVDQTTRNNCQYCRFRRCLDVGMKTDAVRENRMPGSKPRLKKLRLSTSDEAMEMETVAMETSDKDGDELMLCQLLDARPDIMPLRQEVFGACKSDLPGDLDVSGLMNFGYVELRLIIEWSRKVPGFRTLLLEDQMAALKSSFMELSILRLAFRSIDCRGAIRFATDLLMSPEQCVHIGWNAELVSCLLELIEQLRDIHIDVIEFCLLNAIVLTYPDAAGVVDRQNILALQSCLLSCLEKYVTSRYPSAQRRCSRLLLRLSALRVISAKVAEKFLSLSLEGDVKMNALVLEMMN